MASLGQPALALSSLSLVTFSSAFEWVSVRVPCLSHHSVQVAFASVTNLTKSHFNVDDAAVNWLSSIFMLAYIPVFPLPSLVFSKFSLRHGVVAGAFINALSTFFRLAGSISQNFELLFIGQLLAAIAQPFILAASPILADTWYRQGNQSFACSVAVTMNTLGVASGLLFAPYIVTTPSRLTNWMAVQCAVASFVALFASIVMPRDHNHSIVLLPVAIAAVPSATSIATDCHATQENTPMLESSSVHSHHRSGSIDSVPPMRTSVWQDAWLSVSRSVWSALSCTPFLVLCISYGLIIGSSYATSTLLVQILQSIQPNESLTTFAWIGFVMVVATIPGALLLGKSFDRFGKFIPTTVACAFASALALLAFSGILHLSSNVTPIAFALLSLYGIGFGAVMIAGFEVASRSFTQVDVEWSGNLLNLSAQIIGFAQICALSTLDTSIPSNARLISWVIAASTCAGACVLLVLRVKSPNNINVQSESH